MAPMQSFTELYEVERRYEELAHRMSTPDAVLHYQHPVNSD